MNNFKIHIRLLYFILALISFMLIVSCSSNKDDDIKTTIEKICTKLKSGFNSDALIQSGDIFKKEIIQKYQINKKDLPEKYSMMRPCFASLNYKIQIKPENPDQIINGYLSKYYKVTKAPTDLYLEGEAVPAFNIKFTFSVTEKIKDTNNLEITGNLYLLDEKNNVIKSYNIYPTPDFYRFLKMGKGEFKFTAYLSPMWNPFDDDPFTVSAATLSIMQKAIKYKLVLTTNKTTSAGTEKSSADNKDEEILDNLIIK